jgi:DSF synthase
MNSMPQLVPNPIAQADPQYRQLRTHYDSVYQTLWYYLNGQPRPCFTPTLLTELQHLYAQIRAELTTPEGRDIRFLVASSDVPGVFNLGGDLHLFRHLIAQQDRAGLLHYGVSCIEALYVNITHLDADLTTISLVQGDALGGGFEKALSSNVLIAERSAKMGMPEILFNLFPGMGAYSLLQRKIGMVATEKMILSGRIYQAEELHDMGVVDILAEDGEGERTVYAYIKKHLHAANGYAALRRVRDLCAPITYEELYATVEIWVEAALRLTSKDLRMMDRLIARQSARHAETV